MGGAPFVGVDTNADSMRSFIDDPYATYSRWRTAGPIVRLTERSYFAGSFDGVREILQDHERFSSEWNPGRLDETGTVADPFRWVLIADDPPRHTRLRNLVNRAFTPRRVGDLEPAVRRIVDECIDAFPNDGSVDFMGRLGIPLPVTVIAALLGVPHQELPRFRRWSAAVIALQRGEAEVRALGEMSSFLGDAIDVRRSAAMDDLISALTHAEIDGERLKDWEVKGFAAILLVAGNESTAGLLGNMVDVLVSRPGLWERVRADRSLIEPFIEETLRFDSPVQILTRWPAVDTEVGGIELPARAWLSVGFAAANRDPAAFAAPDEFRLDRADRAHLAFGGGIHYCLGAPLARLEARVALDRLLDRYGSIERGDGEPTRQTGSTMVRAFTHLPVRFS